MFEYERKRVEAMKQKVAANQKYCDEFKFAAHDKIELLGQTSALHASLKDRCSDALELISIIERLVCDNDQLRRMMKDYRPCGKWT